MPPLTRWYIKLALVDFIAALLLGVLLAARPLLHLAPAWSAAGPAQVHLLVVGWITQLIFGVAYWMFPKHSVATPRGSNAVAVATFVLLNVGLWLRVALEPFQAVEPTAARGWALALAAVLQWLAALGFVFTTWPRVKER